MFELFFNRPDVHLIVSFILALVPVIIWAVLLSKGYGSKKTAVFMFFGGILAVFFMAAILLLGDWVAGFDLVGLVGTYTNDSSVLGVVGDVWSFVQKYNPVALIRDAGTAVIVAFMIAGALEEVFKQWLVRFADDRSLLITDINTSIRYSLVAALGFAFAENIYYFYVIWEKLGVESLLGAVFFRTTFTTAAHMCFSGIWGYYYGKGKFSVNIVEEKRWRKQRMLSSRFLAWVSGMSITQSFRELMVFRGLIVAMMFHAIFNYLLEFGQVALVMVTIVVAFAYLIYLLNKKSGNLMLVNDIDSRQISTMAKRDEEAVIEYIGEIYNKGEFDQVIETCERLLERDPDNNVVKLFQAKAFDKKRLQGYIRNLIKKKEKRDSVN